MEVGVLKVGWARKLLVKLQHDVDGVLSVLDAFDDFIKCRLTGVSLGSLCWIESVKIVLPQVFLGSV
jgi:hypothetical protein